MSCDEQGKRLKSTCMCGILRSCRHTASLVICPLIALLLGKNAAIIIVPFPELKCVQILNHNGHRMPPHLLHEWQARQKHMLGSSPFALISKIHTLQKAALAYEDGMREGFTPVMGKERKRMPLARDLATCRTWADSSEVGVMTNTRGVLGGGAGCMACSCSMSF